MKKAILLIVAIVLLISLGEAAPSVSLEPSNINVNVGETFKVNITVDPDIDDIYAASFVLDYDSSKLNATKRMIQGSFLSQDGEFPIVAINECNDGIRNCEYGETRTGQVKGATIPGILAIITFKAIASGMVFLNFSDVSLVNSTEYNQSIPGVQIYNGSVTIDSNIPPAPSLLTSTQGNFWINYTWQAGVGKKTDSYYVNVNGSWTNGTTSTYSNGSVLPHGWRNISVWAFNSSVAGGLSSTSVSQNTRVANNPPVQSLLTNKVVNEGTLLTFTVSATDADADPLTNSTNVTKGNFNAATGQYSWTPGYADAGIYVWSFNTSDNYGGESNQTITVTVNNVSLSITSSSPVNDPTTMGTAQQFIISLNRTAAVTWYINGNVVQTNSSVPSASYSNSSAGVGAYNVTAIASDGIDSVSRKWTWTVNAMPTYIPPAPTITNISQGNFWINYTWQAGAAGNRTDSYYVAVNGYWTNGTTQTFNYSNVGPHDWSNITVYAYNSSGSGRLSLTSASQSTQVANNRPVQSQLTNQVVNEGTLLTFTVSATDADSDPLIYGTNATKGNINAATGLFSWTPGYTDAGIYIWSFNTSDNYRGESNQTITVTVNDVPSSTELNLSNYTDPTTGNISEDVMITAPDGNVTVLIFNGTNATLDNRPLTNISIQSISQVNFALSGTGKFIGENLTLGPEGARFSPDIQLRFNYTDARIPEGVPESSLTVKFYNTSAARWEDLKIYQRDTSLNYIIVNVSHFSTFALIGIPDTPVDNNNGGGNSGNRGGGGGGGGGGGAPSDEDFKNIERQESRDVYVQKGLTVYKFTIQDIIREIGFDARTSEGLVTAKIELLKARPKKAASDAQGSVYRYFNVVVGTSGYGSSSKLENAYIVFNVPDEWLKNNSAKSVKLMKFKNNSWIDLKTENISPGTYKAYTTGFSGFAVVGITEGTQEIVTIPSSTETQATREIAVPEKESKSSVNLIIIIGVFIVLFSVSFAYLKRKELFKK